MGVKDGRQSKKAIKRADRKEGKAAASGHKSGLVLPMSVWWNDLITLLLFACLLFTNLIPSQTVSPEATMPTLLARSMRMGTFPAPSHQVMQRTCIHSSHGHSLLFHSAPSCHCAHVNRFWNSRDFEARSNGWKTLIKLEDLRNMNDFRMQSQRWRTRLSKSLTFCCCPPGVTNTFLNRYSHLEEVCVRRANAHHININCCDAIISLSHVSVDISFSFLFVTATLLACCMQRLSHAARLNQLQLEQWLHA